MWGEIAELIACHLVAESGPDTTTMFSRLVYVRKETGCFKVAVFIRIAALSRLERSRLRIAQPEDPVRDFFQPDRVINDAGRECISVVEVMVKHPFISGKGILQIVYLCRVKFVQSHHIAVHI